MRITPVLSINYTKQSKTNSLQNQYNKSFQGYVNGNYYSDEIIKEAKEAFKNPNWRKKFMQAKRSVGESLATWHKREGNDLAGRILMGIFTLGLTEITWGLAQTAMDATDNKNIDRYVKKIEECIDDLRKSGGNVE